MSTGTQQNQVYMKHEPVRNVNQHASHSGKPKQQSG